MNPKEFLAMKKVFSLCLVLITLNTNSQTPIDYDNFSSEIATLKLKEAFLHFRDTITTYGSRNEHKHLEDYPILKEKKHLMLPRWSEWIYDNISVRNTKELIRTTSLYHPSIKEWLEIHHDDMVNAYYDGNTHKDVERFKETCVITYSENAVRVPIKINEDRYNTYEELATTIILTYEKSMNHRCLQRAPMLSNGLDVVGDESNAIFACCVMYNKNTKQVKSTINFIR